MANKITKLPSPYYRVTTRAIILDRRLRLLVIRDQDGKYELPGGGWEHDESLEDCIRREIREELGVEVLWTGNLWFAYRGKRPRNPWYLRLCVPVLLKDTNFTMGEGMQSAHFVSRNTLMALSLTVDEQPLKDHLDKIWPNRT